MVVPTVADGGAPLLPAFYAGRSILITGGTGFLGKVLIERLLWTCPDIAELHLLLRSKRGRAPADRLHDLKQSQAFDMVRAECPRQLDKLRAVEGDVALPRLGLSDASVRQLLQVSVVFHSAATLKFWERLERALHHNVTSVTALMDLCDQLPKLEALVHVSTAYSNAERRHVGERVYAAPTPLSSARALVQALPDTHTLTHHLTARFISPKPNTYVFSKCLAECEIEQRADRRYAAAIVRPSVVVSSHRHPCPGWVESLSGPSGVIVGCGKGLLHAFNVDVGACADLIPVDITIDTMLAVAWETATDQSSSVRVYNSCAQEHRVTWRQFRACALRAVRAHPLDAALCYPFILAVRNWYIFKLLELVLQTVPLYIADCLVRACGVPMKISLSSASARLREMSAMLAFFATREWQFDTHNVTRLRERLTPADRDIYNLDIRTVDWDEHVTNFVKGTRKYLMRETDDDLPRAQRHMNRLRVVHYMLVSILCVSVCGLLMSIASVMFRRIAL